jgi:hypothetical protein
LFKNHSIDLYGAPPGILQTKCHPPQAQAPEFFKQPRHLRGGYYPQPKEKCQHDILKSSKGAS